MIGPNTAILGLDTSTDYAVCFVGDQRGHVYGAACERHDRDLSARLYPLFDGLLKRCAMSLADIDVYAAGLGPGSFTGLRIAVTTMRTLAQVRSKPLVGIGTLDILSAAVRQQIGSETGDYCVVLPSRRDEVYAACYSEGARVSGPITASYAESLALVASQIIAGPAQLLERLKPARPIILDAPTAIAFAQLAAGQVASGLFHSPASLHPLYVAAPSVSVHKSA